MVLESGANPDLPVGLRFPEGRNAPQHHLPVFMRPAPMAFPEPQQLPFRATVMVLVPEYTHEVVEVDARQDMTAPEMLARVQDGRDAVRRGRFDRLLPARPQPASHFATVVAFADWHGGTFVVFDCLRYNGTLYSALVSAVMDKGSLLSVAGIRPEQNVEVYVADYPFPLQAADAVDLRSGYTIHFVAQCFPHFAVVMLQDMLRSPGTWWICQCLRIDGCTWCPMTSLASSMSGQSGASPSVLTSQLTWDTTYTICRRCQPCPACATSVTLGRTRSTCLLLRSFPCKIRFRACSVGFISWIFGHFTRVLPGGSLAVSRFVLRFSLTALHAPVLPAIMFPSAVLRSAMRTMGSTLILCRDRS